MRCWWNWTAPTFTSELMNNFKENVPELLCYGNAKCYTKVHRALQISQIWIGSHIYLHIYLQSVIISVNRPNTILSHQRLYHDAIHRIKSHLRPFKKLANQGDGFIMVPIDESRMRKYLVLSAPFLSTRCRWNIRRGLQ